MVVTTYLEMFEPPAYGRPSLEGMHVLRCLHPTAAYYRFLYAEVGRDWEWKDRDAISDDSLQLWLEHPGLELYVLFVDGHPAGYSELTRLRGEVKIVYFGLLPAYIGRGLGRQWLEWTIHEAWNEETRRLWVHTCTLDHPRALANYERAGLRVYKSETIAS